MTYKALSFFALTIATSAAHATDITVSAAASLTDAFNDIAQAYQAEHPEDTVHLNFAGSGALLQQLLNGAPADVFASADQLRMDKAAEAGLLIDDSRRNFAANHLVAIVPSSDDSSYDNLANFVNASNIKRIAIANPEHVPAGRYSKNALEAAGLWASIADKNIPAQNVRQALDYVARGEVDGGFVYQTDAALMPEKVRVVLNIPLDEPLTYPIAALNSGNAAEGAQAFINFVTGDAGQAILANYGFAPAAN
ncbi:molybdate ABC transporter substrate-binding protein [Cardiobacteriaceae bacterium TAE3-ERU3]|nr:molybdate ABC transporter substrate-binding protein [Cardiobacteriaceae bacterium TAE3-ERU3]